MNNASYNLKKKTLKAAKKAYITKKVLQASSITIVAAALIVSAALFLPNNASRPDITLEKASETAQKEVYVDDDVPMDEPLVLYADSTYINAIADIYNNQTNGRKVETLPRYESLDGSALYSRLVRELSAGEGPDIIFLSSNMGMNQSTKTLIDAGFFADMDIIINSHEDFDWRYYNKNVMDSVITNGKRFFIPYQYNVPYMVSTQEKFKKLGLEPPTAFNMESFLDLSDAFYESTKSDSTMFLYFSTFSFFSDILEDGKIQKDKQTEAYFEAMQAEFQRHMAKGDTGSSYATIISNYLNSDTLFYIQENQDNMQERYVFLDRVRRISSVKSTSGYDKVMLYPVILNIDGVGKGTISDCLAINAASPLKNEAFNFIKFMLSAEIQLSEDYYLQIPVLNEAFDSIKQDILESAKQNGDLELSEEMIWLIENTGEFKFRQKDMFILNVIYSNKDFYNYLHKKVSFDEMADSVNRDLEKHPFKKP